MLDDYSIFINLDYPIFVDVPIEDSPKSEEDSNDS
jgi:hypothetical protein